MSSGSERHAFYLFGAALNAFFPIYVAGLVLAVSVLIFALSHTALDLSLMVPALSVGGVLIWKRMPWGFVVAALASIQGALYLLVLCGNSALVIRRGIVSAPGELPIWAPVTFFTTVVALLVLTSIQHETPRTSVPLSGAMMPKCRRAAARIEFSRE